MKPEEIEGMEEMKAEKEEDNNAEASYCREMFIKKLLFEVNRSEEEVFFFKLFYYYLTFFMFSE